MVKATTTSNLDALWHQVAENVDISIPYLRKEVKRGDVESKVTDNDLSVLVSLLL